VFKCSDMSIQINVQQNIYMNFLFITILTCDNSVSKAVESPYNTDVPVHEFISKEETSKFEIELHFYINLFNYEWGFEPIKLV
jgi:hypothetical protein